MKYKNLFIKSRYRSVFLVFIFFLFMPFACRAMPPGTLLYRTSNDGRMFGYSNDPLFVASKGIVSQINSGHAAVYIGKIDGEDYIIEALAGGIVKTPAKYFVNTSLGEKFLGAKIPRGLTSIQQAKVVAIAKNIADKNLAYDFNFKNQKGPGDGEWTCVGLTEKIYESADISNPNNLNALEYDPDYYALDITPDGYDNSNVVNNYGDCFAEQVEFSKIARRTDLLIPAPELIGYDAGLEYEGDRYIFLPYTQFIQSSLNDVDVDISVSESFNDKDVRASAPSTMIALRWSLINNPLSSLKIIANEVKEVALNMADKIFKKNETTLVLNNEEDSSLKKTAVSTSKTAKAKKTVTTKKNSVSKKSTAKEPAVKKSSLSVKVNSLNSATKKNSLINEVSSAKDSVVKAAAAEKSNIFMATSSKVTSSAQVAASKTVSRKVSKQPASTTKSTSSSNNSSSNSNIVNIASSQNSGISSGNSNSSTVSNTGIDSTTTTTSIASSTNNINDEWPKIAYIKRIYSTGDNDWLELFNPTDHDFDLQEAGYRIEKTRAAVAPSLLMRVGNIDDGSYPGGTLIKAHDSYLIVRDDANSFYKDKADAIATRNEFTWGGNGYTLYLGDGAISSNEDENIIDAVGFGSEATYFLGDGPAPEITDNYVLTKIASTSNNLNDFSLLLSDEPGLLATSTDLSNQDNSIPDWEAYLFPSPINSNGLTDLWHFDECEGNNLKWGVGKWGCALELNESGSSVTESIGPDYDLDNLSFSFFYKRNINSRIIAELANNFNEKISLLIEPGMVQIDGLPNSKWRYNQDYMTDDLWHQAALVISRDDQYWALYIDGVEKIRESFVAALPSMESIKVWSNQGRTLIDELAIWPRVLGQLEVKAYYLEEAPFSPVIARESQKAPVLKHFWHFDEGHGSTTIDNVGGLGLGVPEGIWLPSGRLNTAILSRSGKSLSVDLNNSIEGRDYSLSFWWRNGVYPDDGRAYIGLQKDDQNLFGFNANYFRNDYWFNNNYGIFHEGIGDLIPYDNFWHYLALTYDSYRYTLNFYVDGVAKASSSLIWLNSDNKPNHLDIISNSDYSDIDELGIWQGALNEKQIKALFDSTPQFQ